MSRFRAVCVRLCASSACATVYVFAALAGVVFGRVSNPSGGRSCVPAFSSLWCRLLAVYVCVCAWTRCERSVVSPAIGDDVGVEIFGLRVLVPISNPAKVNISQFLLIFFSSFGQFVLCFCDHLCVFLVCLSTLECCRHARVLLARGLYFLLGFLTLAWALSLKCAQFPN